MNYSTIFTLAARTEHTYSAAQSFIRNECPRYEQHLKTASLVGAITALKAALVVIDWVAQVQERSPEYVLEFRIFQIECQRSVIRQLIAARQFDNRYRITGTAVELWARKGQITVSALDRVFCLD